MPVAVLIQVTLKTKLLFCSAHETTTKAEMSWKSISFFPQYEDLQWENMCGVCTDVALAMLGSKNHDSS